MSARANLNGQLSKLCARWEEEVLRPCGMLAGRPRCALLKSDLHYRHHRLRAIRYGSERILDAGQDPEDLFNALADFFNVYRHEALLPIGIARDTDVGLEHPFYEERRRFILSILPVVTELFPSGCDADAIDAL